MTQIIDFQAEKDIITLSQSSKARFVFSTNSRLSVRASLDCDKHEKQQVGGFLLGVNMKRCSVCKTAKPVSEFNVNPLSLDGRDYRCKACKKTYDRERALKKTPNMRTNRRFDFKFSSHAEYSVYIRYRLKPAEYNER